MACRERRAVAIFQTSWRTLQQNLTNKCSARSCSHTTHPSSHSNRNYIQQQLLVECKKDQWLHSQSPQTVCGQRGPGPGAETTMDPPSSAISPGTNTNQQPELTRENQEIQQDQLLWPGQCNGLMVACRAGVTACPGILPPPPLNFIPSLPFSSLSSSRLPHQTICLVLLALPPKALPCQVVNKTLLPLHCQH